MKGNIIFIFACIAILSIIMNFDVKSNILLKPIAFILGIILVTELIAFIGFFFNMNLGAILIYLMWFYAICIFFCILKRKSSNVFK